MSTATGPPDMATLTDSLDHLLGRRRPDALVEAFDIRTVEDLLRHYPHRYAAQGRELTEKEPEEGSHVTIHRRVVKADVVNMKSRRGQMLKVVLAAESQSVDVTFFNPHKVKHAVRVGVRAMFSGTVKYFRNKWSLTHPSYLILPEPAEGEDPWCPWHTCRGRFPRRKWRAPRRFGSGVDIVDLRPRADPAVPGDAGGGE